MAEHYFTQQPQSAHAEGLVQFAYRGIDLAFTTDAGTFSRTRIDPGSALLLEAMGDLSGACADIGCGWGAIGLSLAAANPDAHVTLIDINARCAELAKANAVRNGLGNVRVCVGDALEGIDQMFDHIVTNPPVRAGKAVVQRFFDQARARLCAGGDISVVLRKAQGAPSAKAYLAELFGNCATVARGGGYHILRSVVLDDTMR